MNSYKTSKLVLGLASIVVGSLLYVSLAPIAFGGLDVAMDDDLTVEYDGADLIVDGNISIASSMPWDINLEYEVILGTLDNPIYSITNTAEIKSGETGSVSVNFNVGTDILMLYFLSCVESEFKSNSVDGTFEGLFSLPLTVLIDGDYVQSIVKFSVGVGFDLGSGATGMLELSGGGSDLNGWLTFIPDLSILFTSVFNVTFDINTDIGSIHGTMTASASGVTYNIAGTDSLAYILGYFLLNGGDVELNGSPVTLTPEQINMMISSIIGMLDYAKVV